MARRHISQNTTVDPDVSAMMSFRVLILESDPEFAFLHQSAIESAGYEAEVCSNVQAAMDLLPILRPHVMMIDHMIGGKPAEEFVQRTRGLGYVIPFVVLFDEADQTRERGFLDLGVYDTAIKDAKRTYLQSLVGSLRSIFRRHQLEMENHHLLNIVQRQNLELDELQREVATNSLVEAGSGYFNKAAFMEFLQKSYLHAERTLRPVTVLQIGLDCLEQIDDTFGREFTESVLVDIADRMVKVFRNSDIMARMPDGRFSVLLPDTPPDSAFNLVERLRTTIKGMTFFDGVTKQDVSISAGVSSYPSPRITSYEHLLERAGVYLDWAIGEGGNRVLVAPNAEEEILLFQNTSAYQTIAAEMSCKLLDLGQRKLQAAHDLVVNVQRAWGASVYSPRTADLSVAVADIMGLAPERIESLRMAAVLHDLGMVVVPEKIRQKQGPLEPSQWRMVVRHPEWGVQLTQPLTFLGEELVLIRHHHERFDGSGYPAGLKGGAIPLGARILACTDALVSMTEERSYRPAIGSEQAIGEIKALSGKWFDPKVVDTLLGICS